MPRVFRMPQVLGDGRLDSLISLLDRMADPKSQGLDVFLDWKPTEEISPAGYALLAVLADSAAEHGTDLQSIHVPRNLGKVPFLESWHRSKAKGALLPAETLVLHDPVLLFARDRSIDPFFTEHVRDRFERRLGKEALFDIRLVTNELMQNTVDHAGAERYYLYAGLYGDEFHFGVLDMGITIPGRLERKYVASNDVEFLELAFRKGVGTRRTREGGVGLSYVWDVVKRNRGRLTVISRGAQLRKYFETRRSQRSLLKRPLMGTWFMIRIPLGREP